ncbi:hypothetical protein J2S41_003216 [Catenuloplanes atrovinosus]|uniref:Uncharacterized protein n=1 Tax=Catenuloplanes atrovinosus TaxID=137266 RepID=A0AAE3YQ92_9ACTN|nr:hypothetical protein [Catenuloplanes atrovinosus]
MPDGPPGERDILAVVAARVGGGTVFYAADGVAVRRWTVV